MALPPGPPAVLDEVPGRFAVVIPVYNHGDRVRGVAGAAAGLGLPVVVVDDGSEDGAGDRVRNLAGVRLLWHRENRGKGAALLTGFAAAAGVADWAVTLDADGQHDPAEIPDMIRALPVGLRPIVVGVRRGMDGPGVPWTSRFGRGFSNVWVRVSGGPRLADSQCGFRIYPLPEVLELPVAARRYQYEVEVLVRAHWRGIPVLEAPVGVRYGRDLPRISHFHPFFDFLRNGAVFGRLILGRIFTPRSVRRARAGTGAAPPP